MTSSLIAIVAVAGCSLEFGQHRNAAADASADAAVEVDAQADSALDAATPDAAPIESLLDFSADVGVHATSNLVTTWDDQSGHGFTATAATTTGPLLTTTTVNGNSHPVLRFDGTTYLIASPHVPPSGTLIIVYNNVDHLAGDRRVLGWEDTTAGVHGLGLIPDYHGADVALFVARNAGAMGDIDSGSGVTEMEVDTASWGAAGITFERRRASGQTTTFSSPAIQTISDGGYSLHIGAPGDGASGVLPFKGDLAALRVYDRQLTAIERDAVAAGFVERWFRP